MPAARSTLGIDDLKDGQEFWGVLAELVIDSETNRRRVRTLPGQLFPGGVFVECSKPVRNQHALCTVFKVNIGISRKPVGRLYVRSLKKQELLTVDEWEATYGSPSIKA
jgi:hypothetical protein